MSKSRHQIAPAITADARSTRVLSRWSRPKQPSRPVIIVGVAAMLVAMMATTALAEIADVPMLVQDGVTPLRPNMWVIAEEVAQENFAEQFGSFNLFIIFFVTLGPLKVIPTFLQVTCQADRTLKRQLAWRSTAMASFMALVVVLIGQNLLRIWQIQLPALMIAGGILLSLVALRLILAQYAVGESATTAYDTPGLHLAMTPLAFPAILPPFGIAIALMLMVLSTNLGFSPTTLILLLLLVMALNLVSMLAAVPIIKFVRPVTLRILGFSLGVMQFALGIQFILFALELEILVLKLLLRGQ
ncbi:MarC family protein [Halomicronema sp. CCY15110]|uniref:MarC family protein n=1 Tax=Halomicronema sp. CCY15110 TaxID=2767773 RepID=UPI00194EF2BD|nr:MarC family protein [Halomicronema sp. CCY15110]